MIIQVQRSADLCFLHCQKYGSYQNKCISCLTKAGQNTAACRFDVTASPTCRCRPAARLLCTETRQGMLMLETTTACAADHRRPPVLLQRTWLSSRAAWHWCHLLSFLAPKVKRAVVCGVQDHKVLLAPDTAGAGDFCRQYRGKVALQSDPS